MRWNHTMNLAAALTGLVIHVHAGAAKGPDFDGDGFADLAVGASDEVAGVTYAGSVTVIYGSASGLADTGDQLWHLNKPGMPAALQADASFGQALAWGDFNGDGRDDLAIGASGYDLPGKDDAGIVVVLYGSGSGLKTQGSQLWHQDVPGIQGQAQELEYFGGALASGDFNHDGRDDLAIGIVGELGDYKGAVAVIYGSPSGLTASGDQLLSQDSPGFANTAEENDSFGAALAVGDFNNDNRDDLAVGVTGESINDVVSAGAVHIIYGSDDGLTAAGNKLFHQDSPGVADIAELSEEFGYRLCSGDFNHDGCDDLAVTSFENLGAGDEGAVHVLYGSSSGLKSDGSQFWHQNKPGIADAAEQFDNFGVALVAGDFDGDGRDDLAIGVREDIAGVDQAGAVHVLYGSGSGLTSSGNQFWHQDKPGIHDTNEPNDNFGEALAAGDFDHDGRDDLAIGVPGEDLDIPDDAVVTGVRVVLFGLSHGYPRDMDIVLESPTGQAVMLMSDVAGDTPINDIVVTFVDGAQAMPDITISSGTYAPTNNGSGDVLPGLDGPYGASLASFDGFSPIGDWKLYIHDDFPSDDNGSLDAWAIVISTLSVGQHVGQITFGATTSPYPSTITISAIPDAGAVNVLYGTPSGLKANGDQFWHRDRPSISGKCQMSASFGSSM